MKPMNGERRESDICLECGAMTYEEYEITREFTGWRVLSHSCIEMLRERIERLEELIGEVKP